MTFQIYRTVSIYQDSDFPDLLPRYTPLNMYIRQNISDAPETPPPRLQRTNYTTQQILCCISSKAAEGGTRDWLESDQEKVAELGKSVLLAKTGPYPECVSCTRGGRNKTEKRHQGYWHFHPPTHTRPFTVHNQPTRKQCLHLWRKKPLLPEVPIHCSKS